MTDHLAMKVEDLELSIRSLLALKNEGINYVGELIQKKEYELRRRKFAGKSVKEIKEVLASLGLALKDHYN